MARLVVNREEADPITHELVGHVITIGRAPLNHIVINNPTVSAQHAILARIGGSYRLKDLHSTSGTQVNGVSITDAKLKDGDEIRLGDVASVFRYAAASVGQTRELELAANHDQPVQATKSRGALAGLASVGKGAGAVLAWIGEKSEQRNAEAKNRAETAREGIVRRGNYFARHWRGQLSLSVSYWLSGFLVSFIVGLAAITVTEMQETMSLKMLSALWLLLYAAAIIASLWWSVGVWRSASRHFLRGGTRFWAGVAKAIVILGLLSSFALIWRTYIPQSAEMLSIIAGDARLPPYEIRVLPGGTEIEFRGSLRAGSANELERILATVPGAKALHIESQGGRIHEAREMIQVVRKRGLITYTSEECLSAATFVLMSGKERVIAANAKVGFHGGWLPGLTAEQQREAADLVRSTMHSAGVSEKFIERVLATPPDQMWYPSFEDMLRNGVASNRSLQTARIVTAKDQSSPRGKKGPEMVSITQSVSIPLASGGVSVLPVGTKLKFVSRDESEVRIRYIGREYAIPVSVTDLK